MQGVTVSKPGFWAVAGCNQHYHDSGFDQTQVPR